jgi:choline dehydrogenase-like flavoprotein
VVTDINGLGTVDSLACDVCIIGSGAAGIAIAREFIGTQHSVILLEGGGTAFESRSQDPYKSEVVGLKHDGIHNGRVRVVGGTTTLWPGQTIPLWPVDFQKRSWVPLSGWPLDRDKLIPYFDRSADVLQVQRRAFEVSDLSDRGENLPVYQGDGVSTYFSQFSPMPNFSQAYRGQIAAAENIKLITHANVLGLEVSADATSVREVKVRSFEGKALCVRAQIFIVCCGGIETARLLLVSNSVEPAGIGNRNDVVGRYFQDHPGVAMAVRPLDHKRFTRWYGAFRRGDIKIAVKFTASEKLQHDQQILNVGGEVFYPISFAITAAKMMVGSVTQVFRKKKKPAAGNGGAATGNGDHGDKGHGESDQTTARARLFESLASVANRLDQVGRTAFFKRYVLGKVATAGSLQPHVGFSVEQVPNAESRITLGREVDCLGVRRSVLQWKVTETEGRSIQVFAQALADEWRKLGLAEYNPDDLHIAGRERGEHGGFIDASHHMGTTRMGTDPATSVVNPDCLVHGYHNLYIGSSAVFPTSGFSNPTFTILALCMRISDDVKARLRQPQAVV